jgi:hypothetical protein
VVLAALVAIVHGTAVLFMLTGALLALRWPWLLWLHVPVALVILALYLTGSDCPFTTWELALREQAGLPGYRGGFIGHYVTEPLGFPVHATTTQVGIYVVAILPNLIGYGLLARRLLTRPGAGAISRTRARAPGRRRRGRRRRTPWPRAAARRAGRRTSSRTSAPGRG